MKKNIPLLVLIFLATLTATADNVFTGPGLWTDGTKWSGGRPTPSSTVGAVIHGLCAATNEAEIIYGPNKWTAVGDWSDSGRTTGRLDINNTWMSFPTELDIGGDSEYFQEGGTNVMTKGVKVGYGAGYAFSRMHMKNVDYVRIGADSTFGQSAPASGGYAEYLQEGGVFSSSAALTLQRNGRMCFRNARLDLANKDTIQTGGAFYADNCVITNSNISGGGFTVNSGSMSFTNCSIKVGKPNFGNSAGSVANLYFTNTSYTCTYQTYICKVASSTCRWEMVDCAWTNTDNEITIGGQANSCAEVLLRGRTSLNVSGKSPYVAFGANSRAVVVFEDADASEIASVPTFTFVSTPATAYGRLIFRNLTGTKAWTLPIPAKNRTADVAVEFDNAHYRAADQYIPRNSATNKLMIVLNNGASFTDTIDTEVSFTGQPGQTSGICATNSTVLFLCGKNVTGNKANCDLTFSFYDSNAAIATGATWTVSSHASSRGRLIVDGTSGMNVVDVYTLAFGSGTNDIHLCGNVFRVYKITGSGVSQKIHFNGGTLRSRANQATWIPASFSALVEDDGAVFDARHNVTIPGVLRHGGTDAKDGGVTKKGAGTLTLSSTTAHEFTGDVVVEEGTLVATALSNWTLAAGQKIGGAGTLKVGSGFTAGGVRFDAAWEGGLTVDGDVALAPGSTFDVTGIDKDTEEKSFTILTANSLSGVENISMEGLPYRWKLRASATSLSIAKDAGFILLVR